MQLNITSNLVSAFLYPEAEGPPCTYSIDVSNLHLTSKYGSSLLGKNLHISLPQIESPCSYEDDEFGRRRGTHCSFLMRTASSPTPTNLAAEAENEDNGEAGNSNSELRRPTQGGARTPCSSVFSANVPKATESEVI